MPSQMKGDIALSTYQSADIGFCPLVGYSGSVLLTWNDNSVVSVECSFGDYKTCRFADKCELYQRRPVGFIQKYPSDESSSK